MLFSRKKIQQEANRDFFKMAVSENNEQFSAKLTDLSKITGKRTWFLNRKIINIGRALENDIVIARPTISNLHARIETIQNVFYLKDCGSKNKTRVNGAALNSEESRKLKNGDEIALNDYRFKFSMSSVLCSESRTGTLINFSPDSETRHSSVIHEDEMPQAILIDLKNITGGKTLNLNKRIINIGRGIHNQLIIPRKTVSGSHATIQYKDHVFYLEDQRSTNKTKLNGKDIAPYSPVQLKSGDEIFFDEYKFIFLMEYQIPMGDTDKK